MRELQGAERADFVRVFLRGYNVVQGTRYGGEPEKPEGERPRRSPRVRADRGAPWRGGASAPRLRDRDHRLPGRARASRLGRPPWPARPRGRAVDGRHLGRGARGTARARVRPARRRLRGGATLAEPARGAQADTAPLSGAVRRADPGCHAARRCVRARDRRRLRGHRRRGAHRHPVQPLGRPGCGRPASGPGDPGAAQRDRGVAPGRSDPRWPGEADGAPDRAAGPRQRPGRARGGARCRPAPADRRAPGRADRELRAVRHEHRGRDPAGARGLPQRQDGAPLLGVAAEPLAPWPSKTPCARPGSQRLRDCFGCQA